jgi:hypothetical protein
MDRPHKLYAQSIHLPLKLCEPIINPLETFPHFAIDPLETFPHFAIAIRNCNGNGVGPSDSGQIGTEFNSIGEAL